MKKLFEHAVSYPGINKIAVYKDEDGVYYVYVDCGVQHQYLYREKAKDVKEAIKNALKRHFRLEGRSWTS